MEKLMELLNEYNCNVLGCSDRREYKDYMGGIRLTSVGAWKIYLYVISKEYGFIKYLVDNDKIDYEKSPGEIMFDDRMGTTFSLEDSIVMTLSISENPIEDLILYLK